MRGAQSQVCFSAVRKEGDLCCPEPTESGQAGMQGVQAATGRREGQTKTGHWREDQKQPPAQAGAHWAAEIPTQLPNKGPFDRWPCNRAPLLSEL